MVLEVPWPTGHLVLEVLWSPGGGGGGCGLGRGSTDWTGAVRESGMLVVSHDSMGSRLVVQVPHIARFLEDW